ncbi:bacillithiol biosynthesis cysteine-adding enzyme BshC [Paenibacillus sp. ACRRX]|uniref:bacillithiol biosynthesis cysteine-adding enzyme BshC n=1 Tax=Paenibacillus sp. ACRRX TaxID=2918206 RepID=UPI001EF454FB|nr:bacillithiol biosynthesis cysteine-adding enzyme BshC [Paenibacillus sp. ACRRX]MCG7407809.1 bacillithiol biosynthesis cysteine-adding enzyme BshC [Paenibacillus sp. ACRRX]
MMSWPTMPIPTQQDLSRHYIERNGEIIHKLYEFHPDEDWDKRVQWIDESHSTRVNRSELAEVLERYQKLVNPAPEAMQSLSRLKEEDALVIVGGQQGGLFMGPLLMIYKAISIIRMSQEAEQRLGRPVVPVFWLAGEDHDYDEVNHTYVLTTDPAIQRIRVDKDTDKRMPVSQLHLSDEAWQAVLKELETSLPQSEFKPIMMDRLQRICSDGRSLTEACALMLGQLFGQYGLVLLDSADPLLRRLEQPMFEQLILKQAKLHEAVDHSERNITESGYTLQAVHAANSANLFLVEDGERLLLLRDEDVYADRHGRVSLTQTELLQRLEAHPEQFSNNVLTRPLMQDYLFPVLGTVLGPGEIAYWAQTKDSFHVCGMRMPILWPRMGFTCVEGTLQKLLQKYGVEAADICFRYEEKRDAWLALQDQIHLDDRFGALKENVDTQYKELLGVITEALPSLGKLGQTNHLKVLEQIDFLHQRAQDALSKQHETGLRQWERLKLAIWPQDRPQERVLNPLVYECRYGQDWFAPIMEVPVVWNGEHRLVSL